jgi:DNA invertase Pin-like site-specific DNA recombinase
MTDIAVIYCRKSDPNAKSNDPAFEQQETECRRYCEEHGYTVLAARRESYTGTDLENQALLWDCIDDVRRGRANVVVAYSYDRLSREPQMQEVALYEIERKYDGRFEAATEQVDRDDPFREAVRAMLGAAGKVERRRISQRMSRGKVDRSQRGALYGAGVAKFGYKWADDTPGGHTAWLLDEQSAETVRRIFDWFDNGKGARWIARQLNSEGVPTPSRTTERQGHIGNRKVSDVWQHWPIMSILGEPAYCGKMDAYRRQVSWDYIKNPSTDIMEKKKVVTKRDETDPARIALECPAIVSVEQFQRVQLTLQSHKRKEGRPPLDPEEAVMRGHVWCKCGRKMVLVRTSKGYYVYRCRAVSNVVTDPSIQ